MFILRRSTRTGQVTNVGPGEWKPWVWLRDRPTVVVGCPECSRVMTIGLSVHTIMPDGRLSPSLVCPFSPCAFHVMAMLEGWKC